MTASSTTRSGPDRPGGECVGTGLQFQELLCDTRAAWRYAYTRTAARSSYTLDNIAIVFFYLPIYT